MPRSSAKRPDDRFPTAEFFGDEALDDPTEDALGYAPFSAKLADALLKLKPKSGLVLALYGSWGGGKSTMLNFVAKDLGSRPKAQQPTIIRFNPWWFSGQDDLVSIFFEELIGGLKLNSLTDKSLKAALKTVPPLLRILGKMVSNVPKSVLATIGHGTAIAPAFGAGVEQLGKELEKLGVKTLTETKTKIEAKLKLFPSKILIVIDDLDRLTADQIRQMFRLIKAVANFSNIIYITSFDKEIVTAALDPEQVSGENYLAKIVQIAFELPLPDRDALRKMLETRLRTVLKSEPLDDQDWWRAYGESAIDGGRKGVSYFIRTPRNVVQITNYLSLSYPSVKADVNAIDFIIIETLRVFCPSVYDLIRKNQESFCFPLGWTPGIGESPRWTPGVDEPPPGRRRPPGVSTPPPESKLKDFHETALRRLVEKELIKEEDIEPIQRLLVQMFPRLIGIFTFPHAFNPEVDEPPPPRRRGICYQDYFPFYFRLSPPEGGISQAEVSRIIENVEAFRGQLEEFAKPRPDQSGGWNSPVGKSDLVLRELSRNISEITEQNAEKMFVAGFEFLGRVERPLDLESLLSNLLAKIRPDSRLSALKECIDRTKRLESSIQLLRQLESVHDTSGMLRPPPLFHDSNDQPLVSGQQLEDLQRFIASKIEQEAEHEQFLESSRLRLLVACWNAWGNRKKLKEWGQTRIRQPATLGALLAGFLEEIYHPGPGLPAAGAANSSPEVPKYYFLDPQWFSMFVDPSELVTLASKLNVIERQKIAVDALKKTYDQQIADQERNPFKIW